MSTTIEKFGNVCTACTITAIVVITLVTTATLLWIVML